MPNPTSRPPGIIAQTGRPPGERLSGDSDYSLVIWAAFVVAMVTLAWLGI